MIPKLALPFFAAVCLLLAGCYPVSTNPLVAPSAAFNDDQLEGVYLQEDEGERTFWHFHHRIGPAKGQAGGEEVPLLEVAVVRHLKNKGGLETTRFEALSTRLAGRTYFSFSEIPATGARKGAASYGFARYEITWLGEVRVWLASDAVFAQAVKSGQLKGSVARGGEVTLSDTTERLAAFVAAGDPKKLFPGKPLSLGKLPW